MTTFEQTFEELPLAGVHDLAAARHAEGWRYVQILAVNTEEGIDLVYSYMKDGHLANFNVSGVKRRTWCPPSPTCTWRPSSARTRSTTCSTWPSATSPSTSAACSTSWQEKAPMTVVSPEQLAAREKAKKIAAAKAAKEAKAAAPAEGPTGPTEEEIQAKIAGLDPEKAAKVRAAMEAKAKKAAAAARAAGPTEEEIEAKIAGLDPEKAAKVRAAMEAKARKAAEGKGE